MPILAGFCLILVISILGFVALLGMAVYDKNQIAATIYAASLAFLGVFLTVTIQTWTTIYKSTIEATKDTTKKMHNYYENILNILDNPGNYSFNKIQTFLNEFDKKVKVYGGNDIQYKWLNFKLKEIILRGQKNPTSIINEELQLFALFRQAIRKEMGYESDATLRALAYKDFQSKYRGENSLNIQNFEVAQINNKHQDFQTAWACWFDEVEQLEPESPQSKPDESGKALIDKYKKQGLDL